jgi:esterase/lipase
MNTENYFIESSLGDNKNIHIKVNYTDFNNPILLMTSGRTLPPIYTNSFVFEGCSFIDLLVNFGITVITVDYLGTGQSSDYTDSDLEIGPRLTYDDAYRDLCDAFVWLKNNKNVSKVSIYGNSATAVPALMFAEKNSSVIDTIIIQSISNHAPWVTTNYKEKKFKIDFEKWLYRRIRDIPEDRREEILPPSWLEKIKNAIISSGILEKEYHNGLDFSRHEIVNGYKKIEDFFEWKKIVNPIIFTTGAWDKDCDTNVLQEYVDQCSSDVKKISLIPEGTHWISIEKNRDKMAKEIVDFILSNKKGE